MDEQYDIKREPYYFLKHILKKIQHEIITELSQEQYTEKQ